MSRVRSPPEADTFTAVHREFVGFGICRLIQRSSMTMKAHTYYIIFGRPPIGGKLPPSLHPPPFSGGATACNGLVREVSPLTPHYDIALHYMYSALHSLTACRPRRSACHAVCLLGYCLHRQFVPNLNSL